MTSRLLIIDVAGLGFRLLEEYGTDTVAGIAFKPTDSVFPAVTCTVQASFRTAAPPRSHGMVANGLYLRDLRRALFWEQSAGLVSGSRIWEPLREAGGRVGMLFWQQSLGESVDMVFSPAPIHKHGGGMITGCLARPPAIGERIRKAAGGAFPLHRYWGPLAAAKVGDWIAKAIAAVVSDDAAPELLLTYLPSLDYDLQRFGPSHPKVEKAFRKALSQLETILSAAQKYGYQAVVFGDYAVAPVSGKAVLPNRALKEAGLLAVRDVGGMEYTDLHHSRAFAVTDHEVAHVYVSHPEDIEEVRGVMAALDGILHVAERASTIDHPAAGELVAVSAEGRWLAYPWWNDRKKAPDFAAHVDIHNKPGFDPCELFFGCPPTRTSRDTSKIAGSHGRVGPGREVAWGATIELEPPGTLIELARSVSNWIQGEMC